jgi:Restriction endonuclease AspBHI N-terminal/Restriction endonuclease
MAKVVPFDKLAKVDLIVDAVYQGGTSGNVADDALGKLVPVGNQGGFRYAGSVKDGELRLVVLYTSGADRDWPDALDRETGLFTYYGDNREPGKQLHDTSRSGNVILRACFDHLHGSPPHRDEIPPFLLFDKASHSGGRDVRFLGLAVPGAQDVQPVDDLVAIWRTSDGERFQNYRATLTILDVATVPRAWLKELAKGEALGASCPKPYHDWVMTGKYRPLESPRTIEYRTKAQQQPMTNNDEALVKAIYDYFVDDSYGFEACAIELWKMQARESVTYVATRQSVDGGRDAYGDYYLGPEPDRVPLAWSLEAKLYAPDNGAGVKETSRLISRLRHREFGVFVTTAYVGKQAYEEIRGDKHPIIVICGRDIAELLKKYGYSTPSTVKAWLKATFPRAE